MSTKTSNTETFAARAVKVAIDQWSFFGKQTYDLNGAMNYEGHKEGEQGFYQRIGQYWEEGTSIQGIDGQDHEWYWSAAFISWVMKQAGAGLRFRYSTQHSVFISQGIRNFLQNRVEAGYWTRRLNEAKPEVGDIVCWAREKGVDYDNQKQGNYAGHSDLIVSVEDKQIWVIGGNVGNSVTKRPLPLDKGYVLAKKYGKEYLFAIMKNRINT